MRVRVAVAGKGAVGVTVDTIVIEVLFDACGAISGVLPTWVLLTTVAVSVATCDGI
jgi:hypothetical protein